MKKLILLMTILALFSLNTRAQTKKDGTPDMRYRANKEVYGNSNFSGSNQGYNYSQPKVERNYENGGQYKIQNGYSKSNGTFVQPHIKTKQDNYKWNNKNNRKR